MIFTTSTKLDRVTDNLVTSLVIGGLGASLMHWLMPQLAFWPWFALMSVHVFFWARVNAGAELKRYPRYFPGVK